MISSSVFLFTYGKYMPKLIPVEVSEVNKCEERWTTSQEGENKRDGM